MWKGSVKLIVRLTLFDPQHKLELALDRGKRSIESTEYPSTEHEG